MAVAKCVVGVKEKHYCKSKKVNPGYTPYPLFYSTHGNRVCTPWCDLLCDWRSRSMFRLYELHSNRLAKSDGGAKLAKSPRSLKESQNLLTSKHLNYSEHLQHTIYWIAEN